MECVWGLFGYRQPDGYRRKQDQALFYVRFHPHHGFSHHYLYDIGFLAEYPQIYLGCQTESLVLSLSHFKIKSCKQFHTAYSLPVRSGHSAPVTVPFLFSLCFLCFFSRS
jgi:hypothetical protein